MKRMAWVALLAWLVAGVVSNAAAQFEEDDTEQQPTESSTTSEKRTQRGPNEAEPSATAREELKRTITSSSSLDLPGAVDPDAYRVGPGDLLQVSMWGGISRSISIEIGPEGTVQLPSTGTLFVNGLTLREARQQILGRLRTGFRGVNLDVHLLRPRKFQIYITGMVKNAGPYPANGTSRVGDLVPGAEPMKNASLRRIEVMHRDGSQEVADLELFLRTGSQALNPWVRDGDVLQVPAATDFIYVQGAVARTSKYELGPRDSLRTLLALSGGLLAGADSTRAMLVRWIDSARSETLWVNLPGLLAGSENPPLRSGDHFYVFFVPLFQLQNEVTILGQIQRPGVYPVKVGRDHISDVIRVAGGFLPGADLAGIRVRRQNPLAGVDDPELTRLLRLSRKELTNSEYDVLTTKLAGLREEYRIDWNRLQGDPKLDVLIVGGDVVLIDRQVNSIRVDGQVRRPGIVSFQPGQRVDDYVRAAGGYSERAWRNKIRVTRSVTGQTFLARDVQKLDAGDFIWVPERPDLTVWDQARALLGAAAEVATVILAFTAARK